MQPTCRIAIAGGLLLAGAGAAWMFRKPPDPPSAIGDGRQVVYRPDLDSLDSAGSTGSPHGPVAHVGDHPLAARQMITYPEPTPDPSSSPARTTAASSPSGDAGLFSKAPTRRVSDSTTAFGLTAIPPAEQATSPRPMAAALEATARQHLPRSRPISAASTTSEPHLLTQWTSTAPTLSESMPRTPLAAGDAELGSSLGRGLGDGLDAGDGPGATVRPIAPRYESAGPTRTIYHRIVDGDTLAGIARRYYGDESRWDEIFRANRTLLPDADILPLGADLEIAVPANSPLLEVE